MPLTYTLDLRICLPPRPSSIPYPRPKPTAAGFICPALSTFLFSPHNKALHMDPSVSACLLQYGILFSSPFSLIILANDVGMLNLKGLYGI